MIALVAGSMVVILFTGWMMAMVYSNSEEIAALEYRMAKIESGKRILEKEIEELARSRHKCSPDLVSKLAEWESSPADLGITTRIRWNTNEERLPGVAELCGKRPGDDVSFIGSG